MPAPLAPGEHSIDRVKPRRVDGQVVIDWSLRLPDGKLTRHRTQARSVGEARRRAKTKAADLLRTSPAGWSPASSFRDYIEQVTVPAIETAGLSENTQAAYATAVRQILERLGDLPVGQAMRRRSLEQALTAIDKERGPAAMRRARSVLSRHVIQQLLVDEVIDGDPLSGLVVGGRKKTRTQQRPQALTAAQWSRCLDVLLAMDPERGLGPRARGRWTREQQVAARQGAIDLTLLQATTGLRVSEANAVRWDQLVDEQIRLAASASKTGVARVVPVIDQRVVERLQRRQQTRGGTYVIGSPADPDQVWERANCRKRTAPIYKELASLARVPLLKTARTHVWRATLNTVLAANGIPAEHRAQLLGHTVRVADRHYLGTVDLTPAAEAARAALRSAQRSAQP